MKLCIKSNLTTSLQADELVYSVHKIQESIF